MRPFAAFLFCILSASLLAQSPFFFRKRMLYSNGSGAPADYLTGIYMLLTGDAETNVTSSGNNITAALDQSGNHFDTTGASSVGLIWPALNGHAVMQFSNNFASTLTLSNVLTTLTQGHLFIVIKLAADPISGTSERLGVWGVGGFDLYPYWGDNKIYTAFGIQSQNVTVDPTPDLSATYRLYEVAAYAGGATTNWLDTSVLAGSTGNTIAFTNAPTLGDPGRCFNGTVAEMRIYTAPLVIANATTVRTYLKNKYGLTGF